jgi:hypothetical protein
MSYRFEGTNLMLLDVEADLVVDVLERALPSSGKEESELDPLDPEDTCAPEPMPLIEGESLRCPSGARDMLELKSAW